MNVEEFAVTNARREFAGLRDPLREDRQPLNFPPRPIVLLPHDPLAYAVRAIDGARADFEFALAEAFTSGDRAGLETLLAHLEKAADGLLVCEAMGKDFRERMQP